MKLKIKQAGWIIFLSALSGISAMAQKVTIDGEFRPRSEYRQGYKTPLADSVDAALVTIQRTRLGANYKSNTLEAKVTLQASSVYGETDTKNSTTVGIYEAWADVSLFSGLSLKAGRQGVQYEDGRLFSKANWSNTGNSHDLGLLKYRSSIVDADLGFAYGNASLVSQESAYAVPKMYKTLAFGHFEKGLDNGLKFTVLGVDEGYQEGITNELIKKNYHRYTTGGTVALNNDSLPLDFLFTGYYQFGKGTLPSKTTTYLDLNAYLLSIKANYAITKAFGLSLGYDYFSGTSTDDLAKGEGVNTFNRFTYSGNHGFNGYMDYWATLPNGGLSNIYGGAGYKFNKKLKINAMYYLFSLAEDMSGVDSKDLGSELDITLDYKLSAETALQLGWSTYFTTESSEILKKQTSVDTQFPQYAYLMLTIKPKFLVSK